VAGESLHGVFSFTDEEIMPYPPKPTMKQLQRRLKRKLCGQKWTTILDCTKQQSDNPVVSLGFKRNDEPATLRTGMSIMVAICSHMAATFRDSGAEPEAEILINVGAKLLQLWDKLERDAAIHLN
jgi:hypothetical protein